MLGIEAFELLNLVPAFLARLKMLTLPCERMIFRQIAVCRRQYTRRSVLVPDRISDLCRPTAH